MEHKGHERGCAGKKPCCRGAPTWLKLAVLTILGSNAFTFASPKQGRLDLQRQREGLSLYTAAAGQDLIAINHPSVNLNATTEEKKLATYIMREFRNRGGGWGQVQQILSGYSGNSPFVLDPAMRAALKFKMYQEGASIFEEMKRANAPITLPVHATAMKLYGKLNRLDQVRELWKQLVNLDLVNEVNAQACIDANADNGNITGAGEVLEYMENESISMSEMHFTSAINACANSNERHRSKAAKFLLESMTTRGITPNTVTYSCAMRAMDLSSAQDLLDLLADMKAKDVRPNNVIAENFFYMFLKQPRKGCWTSTGAIAADFCKLPREDLETAKSVMDEFVAAGVDLNASCRRIRKVLESLLEA